MYGIYNEKTGPAEPAWFGLTKNSQFHTWGQRLGAVFSSFFFFFFFCFVFLKLTSPTWFPLFYDINKQLKAFICLMMLFIKRSSRNTLEITPYSHGIILQLQNIVEKIRKIHTLFSWGLQHHWQDAQLWSSHSGPLVWLLVDLACECWNSTVNVLQFLTLYSILF